MATNFKGLSEDSPNFLLGFGKDVWMDVKYALLMGEGVKKMFKEHYFLYLMVINMNKANRIKIDKEFMAFVTSETGLSRAYIYRSMTNMISNELLFKTDVRSWYRVRKVKLEKR